ncbi:MAG TPA: hypothetical protein VF711_07405 [Acidimicrobiales bacterium]
MAQGAGDDLAAYGIEDGVGEPHGPEALGQVQPARVVLSGPLAHIAVGVGPLQPVGADPAELAEGQVLRPPHHLGLGVAEGLRCPALGPGQNSHVGVAHVAGQPRALDFGHVAKCAPHLHPC